MPQLVSDYLSTDSEMRRAFNSPLHSGPVKLRELVQSLKRRVDRFISKPVPPPRTPEFDVWLAEARSLDHATSPVLLSALEHGTEAEQYAALLALRQQGYEAWGDGYDDEFVYKVSHEGGSMTIKPLIRDQ